MKAWNIGLALAIACGGEQGFGEGKGENTEGGVGVLQVSTEVTCNVLGLGDPKLGGIRIENTDPEFGVRIEDIQIIDGGETVNNEGNTTSAFTNLTAQLPWRFGGRLSTTFEGRRSQDIKEACVPSQCWRVAAWQAGRRTARSGFGRSRRASAVGRSRIVCNPCWPLGSG